MASKYTCQRCLAQIRSRTTPNAIPKIRINATGKRWHSIAPQTPKTTKRAASTAQAAKPTEHYHASGVKSSLVLTKDNLFHPFSKSPIPEIRQRAEYIKSHAYCPHPSHRRTRLVLDPNDPESRKPESKEQGEPPKHVNFECPDCGIPVYCCEEHWADDYEAHLEICDTLRQINEDDHDLRSGRVFEEFKMAEEQMEEILANMLNWDTLLYTREFEALNDLRHMRQATRLLTYPITIGSILHENSPYNIRSGGRLTPEGLRSLSALRYTLHPPRTGEGSEMKNIRLKPPPVRIFILGARAESSLPREVWVQLAYLFPRVAFHLIFIGPESMINRDREFPLPERTPGNPFGAVVEDRISHVMKITTYVDYYHTLHEAQHFAPFDPYFDVFMLFHPGLGHPISSGEWAKSIPQLLETKCAIFCTGYTEFDMQRDYEYVQSVAGGEVDLMMEPGENRFRSLRWDLNDMEPQDISAGNWGVWGFRGKRYETQTKSKEPAV